ncbi:ABC transporter ATP-binding protein [Pseudoclavibacter sp. CFCC 13796]|uniref:ABC transporter ATP-binding protein n=1 Tax=unclassified Pseudoclavibacter TaxID=2615177 RepID=UPI001300E585|nr:MULTISPECIES: ABC transporter ATP-binding protein [unclassified Pseudoclavibacter]KAB1646342.1 ABC transporter ATP-binding protein [Pseudoclavibacter sp. CFCC 14310]KAB1661783.1 ABC transporter ATP-binding protein [Pseudoclavibacter sp. CFCC 13796]KAB1663496.1 ABC transporter ATP-binding protein [Pseudoclavibacter sp. CFCC 13611]
MTTVLDLQHVSVRRSGRALLDDVSWRVEGDERWVVLGPNGAGKTTLLNVASAQLHPSKGEVRVLGEQLGRVDVFDLRPRIGVASSTTGARIPANESVLDAVLTAVYGVTGRWNEKYDELDLDRAHSMLRDWQLEPLSHRRFGSLSDGERKRVQIARAVMSDPEVLLLDEPTANLDLGAREELLQLLGEYAVAPGAPALVSVTHHVEEIPRNFTHALLLKDGKVMRQGPINQVVISERLSELYGLPLTVTENEGRYAARANLV